jgi:hypothetical protein
MFDAFFLPAAEAAFVLITNPLSIKIALLNTQLLTSVSQLIDFVVAFLWCDAGQTCNKKKFLTGLQDLSD